MSGQAFRLEYSLLSLQRYEDGRTALRMLQPGSDLVVISPEKENGMVETVCDGIHYDVFAADLAARSTIIVPALRTSNDGPPRKGPGESLPADRLFGRYLSR